MSEGLRQAMLGRMKALQANITTLNMIADELEKSANLLDAQPKAKDMRGLARRQRVKVLEMRTRSLRSRRSTPSAIIAKHEPVQEPPKRMNLAQSSWTARALDLAEMSQGPWSRRPRP
ncbi:hypothetical protein PQI07_31305 [Methylobacterium sp. 092160098-2]|uniref:hypothetical protein n=1 Tax=Methylobacterium sp. 092160098-2 TaxID=3025129 RepID=UPI002381D16F|nr:hypothetical protein [Methylobacterium sp. 092160098-2]MDE4915121.1 hypothetical protein [Methylobacterium sp. 092160098-2]